MNLRGIQRKYYPASGPQYFRDLQDYSSNLHRVLNFALRTCTTKGLHITPESLYRAILDWSLHGGARMFQDQVEVVFSGGAG